MSSYLEEIRRLPESHLPAADHIDGMLECLVFRQLRTVDGNPLVFQAGLGRVS